MKNLFEFEDIGQKKVFKTGWHGSAFSQLFPPAMIL